MKIKVTDIIKENSSSILIENQESNIDLPEFDIDGPVSFSGMLKNENGVLNLNGVLSYSYKTQCIRCLKEIKRDKTIKIKERYKSQIEIDDIMYKINGKYIVLDKALKDNIMLNMSMKELCKDDCRGLCSNCGKNLESGSCKCKLDNNINPKFEVLRKLI